MKLIDEINQFYKIPINELVAEEIDMDVFLRSIKNIFGFDKKIKLSIKKVSLCDILPLTNFVYTPRLIKSEKIIQKYSEAAIEVFRPIFLNYENKCSQIVSPPILEIHNGKYVLCDGTHRIYKAIQLRLISIFCIIIEGKSTPPPGDINNWQNLKVREKEVEVQKNFNNYNANYLTKYTWAFNCEKTWVEYNNRNKDIFGMGLNLQ